MISIQHKYPRTIKTNHSHIQTAMIPNHPQFIEAINRKKKIRVRLYSFADNGVVDGICAPMDYGPCPRHQDRLNRYWLWVYTDLAGSHILGLLPEEILDLQVLGEMFDPAQFTERPAQWFTPRDWGSLSWPALHRTVSMPERAQC